MKRLITAFLTVAVCSTGMAQKGNTSSAGISFKNYWSMKLQGEDITEQAKELLDAKGFIDKSIVHETTKDDPKTLMYYGKIYFEIPMVAALSGDVELNKVDPEKAVEDAFNAFQRSKELDTKGRYTEDVDEYCIFYYSFLQKQGVEAYSQEKYDIAMGGLLGAAKFSEVIGTIDTASFFFGGTAAFALDSFAIAEEAFKKTTELGYNYGSSIYHYSQSLQGQGKVKEAEEMLNAQAKANPGNQEVLIEFINLYIGTDRKDEAAQKLNEALALDPENTALLFTSGTIYENLEDYEKAEKAYKKVLEIEPDNEDALVTLGGLFYNKGADANNDANKLEFGDPKHDALKEEAKSNFAKSVEYFEKAVEKKPKDKQLLTSLKNAYYQAGEKEKMMEIKKRIDEL
ncbi:MAG: tetratricopeptide repeat protein [Flavobacteriales bacterium]|nr:tetratricopeptide repeat protein [Flavobacteriales bacterium]